MKYNAVYCAFCKLRERIEIRSTNENHRPPCIHSLRHAFAVHRVTAWYREGADVERLLPVLSTYLGHTDLNGTQVYLSMAPELLQEASTLYDQYVNGGKNV